LDIHSIRLVRVKEQLYWPSITTLQESKPMSTRNRLYSIRNNASLPIIPNSLIYPLSKYRTSSFIPKKLFFPRLQTNKTNREGAKDLIKNQKQVEETFYAPSRFTPHSVSHHHPHLILRRSHHINNRSTHRTTKPRSRIPILSCRLCRHQDLLDTHIQFPASR